MDSLSRLFHRRKPSNAYDGVFSGHRTGAPAVNVDEYREILEEGTMLVERLASYLAELSLLEEGCLRFLPSLVAASATFLARFTLMPYSHPWSLDLEEVSRYAPAQLEECVDLLHDLQLGKRAAAYEHTRVTYISERNHRVSALLSLKDIQRCYFL